jgi:hypothetical protein
LACNTNILVGARNFLRSLSSRESGDHIKSIKSNSRQDLLRMRMAGCAPQHVIRQAPFQTTKQNNNNNNNNNNDTGTQSDY